MGRPPVTGLGVWLEQAGIQSTGIAGRYTAQFHPEVIALNTGRGQSREGGQEATVTVLAIFLLVIGTIVVLIGMILIAIGAILILMGMTLIAMATYLLVRRAFNRREQEKKHR